MLKFPCICGHPFTLAEELAGSQLQCPACGRLVDVPTLSEIHNITPEGTYIVDMAPATKEPQRLRELHRAFAHDKTDETGFQIDLRQQPEDIDKIGVDPVPFADEKKDHPAKPRYDPITGELIRPLHVSGNDPPKPSDIPMAKAVLVYATPGGATNSRFSAARIMYELLLPHNLIVLFFLALFHVVFLLMALGLYYVGIVALPLMFGMIGHYSNIIQETGPAEKDDIPRLFRNFNFGEDLWLPFVNVALSFLICFTPALAMQIGWHRANAWIFSSPLAAAGMFFFPATLMSAATSGTFSNLRPDRIWAVITIARWNYVSPLFWFVAGIALYLAGLAGMMMKISWGLMNFGAPLPGPLSNAFVAYATLIFGMYLLHLSCWQLGLLWRAHHEEFPWIAQRHVPLTHKQRIADNNARRAAARAKYEERQKQQRALRQIHTGPPR